MHTKSALLVTALLGLFLVPVRNARADAIHDAARSGDLEKVKMLVKSNAELLNQADNNGRSPLHHAIKAGKAEVAMYLIDQGADINAKDSDGESPLHYAASAGNVEIARLLLDKDATSLNEASLEKESRGKATPLHNACKFGHPAVVKLLLDRGADPEAREANGGTALIIAATGKSLDAAKILIERGADINALARRNWNALIMAARYGNADLVNYLIDKKADIPEGTLGWAFNFAVRNNLVRLFAYAKEKGPDWAQMKEEYTGLVSLAAESGSDEIFSSLIDHGFNPEYTDKDGWRPLHYAAAAGKTRIVELLISRGVDKNARTTIGETAYNLASTRGFPEAGSLLKGAGADTSQPQFPVIEGPYMGQLPPGDTPRVFLPNILSGHDPAHSSIIFSPDGKEAYWALQMPPEGRVAMMEMVGNRWSYPRLSSVIDRDPSFSPNGKRLYFIKLRPFKAGEQPGGDPDVKEEYWYMEKTATGWSEPKTVGDAVNAVGLHWPCSVDKDYNLYFSEFAANMYCSAYKNGQYQEPINLTKFLNNETLIGRSPFISPNGDYLLFSAADGLSISFKRKDGTWTDGISLGSEINASHENGSPRITPDGKYLFFLSAGQGRPWGIYWVSSGIIDRLRAEHLGND